MLSFIDREIAYDDLIQELRIRAKRLWEYALSQTLNTISDTVVLEDIASLWSKICLENASVESKIVGLHAEIQAHLEVVASATKRLEFSE
jgi:hypothetical protein